MYYNFKIFNLFDTSSNQLLVMILTFVSKKKHLFATRINLQTNKVKPTLVGFQKVFDGVMLR